MKKVEAKKRIKSIVERYRRDRQSLKGDLLTEQDLQRNYILPLLEALNWDIYDLKMVRQEKFIGDIQPDICLFDRARNIICLEVKPDYQSLSPESDLEKYTIERIRRLSTRVIWLTSFKNSQLHVYSEKRKNKPQQSKT